MSTTRRDGRPVGLLSAATEVGGARMRISALHEALGGKPGCLAVTVPCDPEDACATVCSVTGATRNGPASTWYFDRTYCPAYLDRLVEHLQSAGVTAVICSSLDTSRYLRALKDRINVPLVFDMHNVELRLYRAILAATPEELRNDAWINPQFVDQVAAAEGAAVAAADELWVCSEDDAKLLQDTYPSAHIPNVRVVPNVLPVGPTRPEPVTPVLVAFTGRLNYPPNVSAGLTLIREVAPALAALGSPLQVVVAGAHPGRDLREAPLPANVRLLADPTSVDDVIAQSIVAVPLQEGGGSRFKILEAFNHGAPVVSTAKGVEGLDVQENVHYLRAESGSEFAAAIETLRSDEQLRRALTDRAWRLLVEKYSVSMLREQLAHWRPTGFIVR